MRWVGKEEREGRKGHQRGERATNGARARWVLTLFSHLSFYNGADRLYLPSSASPSALVAAALGEAGPGSAAGLFALAKGTSQASHAPPTTIRAALVANPAIRYSTAPCGTGPATRIFVTASAKGGGKGAVPVSPWHDVPLKSAPTTTPSYAIAGGGDKTSPSAPPLFNFVVEVPAGTTPKVEVAIGEGPLNPLAQDTTKSGAPRFFPAPLWFNYGMLPRTFESPDETDAETGAPGDGDPVDVIEVGGWIDEKSGKGHVGGWAAESDPAAGALPAGAVVPVKVLGALALIDGGELDWKVLAIRASHPAAASLHSVADLEAAAGPGCVDRLVGFYTNYKLAEGKPRNAWGRGGAPISAVETVGVIEGAASAYEKAGLGPPSVAAPHGLVGGVALRTRSRVVLPDRE